MEGLRSPQQLGRSRSAAGIGYTSSPIPACTARKGSRGFRNGCCGALISPRLELGVEVKAAGDDTWRVRLIVQNSGWLPYVTKMAVKRKVLRGVLAEIKLPDGAELVSGKLREKNGRTRGLGLSAHGHFILAEQEGHRRPGACRWVVKGKAGSQLPNRCLARAGGSTGNQYHAGTTNPHLVAAREYIAPPTSLPTSRWSGQVGTIVIPVWVASSAPCSRSGRCLIVYRCQRAGSMELANKVLDEVGQRRLQVRPFRTTAT